MFEFIDIIGEIGILVFEKVSNELHLGFLQLIPNVVSYENLTVIDGDHIELAEETKNFLAEKGHQLEAKSGGAIVQFVVQTLQNPIEMGRKYGKDSNIFHGTLTAVSDPRKDGKPAAV